MSTAKKKDNGNQVETSLEHPNINLEAQEEEKRRRGDKDNKDDKNSATQYPSPNALERIDDWAPERKAHAKKVADACIDLYKFMLDNPSIEGMLSDKMTGVASGLSDPLIILREMGVEMPNQDLPGARRMEREKTQDWWGGEIPEQKEKQEKEEAKQHAH